MWCSFQGFPTHQRDRQPLCISAAWEGRGGYLPQGLGRVGGMRWRAPPSRRTRSQRGPFLRRLGVVAWLSDGLGVVVAVFAAEADRHDVVDHRGLAEASRPANLALAV